MYYALDRRQGYFSKLRETINVWAKRVLNIVSWIPIVTVLLFIASIFLAPRVAERIIVWMLVGN